jgi:hypothetical protein
MHKLWRICFYRYTLAIVKSYFAGNKKPALGGFYGGDMDYSAMSEGDKHLALIKKPLQSRFPSFHQTHEFCNQTQTKPAMRIELALARFAVRLLPADSLCRALEEVSARPSSPIERQQ